MSASTVLTLGLRATVSELLLLGFGLGALTTVSREVVRLDSPICQAVGAASAITRSVSLASAISPAAAGASEIDLEETSA